MSTLLTCSCSPAIVYSRVAKPEDDQRKPQRLHSNRQPGLLGRSLMKGELAERSSVAVRDGKGMFRRITETAVVDQSADCTAFCTSEVFWVGEDCVCARGRARAQFSNIG